ncbi:MAG: fasciclin domain-containing protein, partial [Akkermansiaceae bacterium]|nr:fasciclin domain-containing protein [Akkermansiaceae bacterium]
EAFGKLPAETLIKLMLPENKEKLRMLLLYHVVAGRVLAADLTDGDVKTVNGAKLKIDVSAEKIEVDGAKVFSADVSAINGVMHSIGKVLVPKSLDGFAGLKN